MTDKIYSRYAVDYVTDEHELQRLRDAGLATQEIEAASSARLEELWAKCSDEERVELEEMDGRPTFAPSAPRAPSWVVRLFRALARGRELADAQALDAGDAVIHGDALQTLRGMRTASFDAAITDPPFGLAKRVGLSWAFSSHVTLEADWDVFASPADYAAFTHDWLREVTRVVKPNGNIVIFGSYHNIYLVGAVAQSLGLRILNSIIWAKPNAQPNITCRMFTESTEQMIWICNGAVDGPKKAANWTFNYHDMKAANADKQMRNFWTDIPVTPAKEKTHGKHPTQKPLALLERVISAVTSPGDRVLDCFAGSGTTLVACKRLGRLAVGIERELEHVETIQRRLDHVSNDPGAASTEHEDEASNVEGKEEATETTYARRALLGVGQFFREEDINTYDDFACGTCGKVYTTATHGKRTWAFEAALACRNQHVTLLLDNLTPATPAPSPDPGAPVQIPARLLSRNFLLTVASVAHAANAAHCASAGDLSHKPWSETPEDILEGTVSGVKYAIENPEATPESMHTNWRKDKEAAGWTYGTEKNYDKKTHPNLVPFGDLPAYERTKDFLFLGVVRAYTAADA